MKYLTDAGHYNQEHENGQVFLGCTTARTATLTPLVQSDSSQIAIQNNSAIAFNILIAGRGVSGTNAGKVGYYQLSGIAKNIEGATGVVIGVGGLLGGVIQLVQIEEVTIWNALVTASGGNLSFQVSGDVGTTIQWKAVAQLLYL